MGLTFAQRMRLKASAFRASALNHAVHAVARVRYAMPDAHPKKHGVAVMRNIVYGPTRSRDHQLDVYIPLLRSKPRPVVMYVHGGGFSMLSKDTHRVMAMAFARRGYIVFNINYRLARRTRFRCRSKIAQRRSFGFIVTRRNTAVIRISWFWPVNPRAEIWWRCWRSLARRRSTRRR